MAGDRDLAVAIVRALRTQGSSLRTGWEMTAASGIRGLRLVAEAGPFDAFLLTEAHPRAFEVLAANAAGRPGVRARAADARRPWAGERFDYVDLDPYGSPLPFLGAALGAVREGGVLAVTATDMMVLAGAQPAACRRLYGANPVRGRLGPEGGLRILLGHLAGRARALGRSVRPRVAYVREHHVRAYLTIDPARGSADPVGTIDPLRWDGPPLGGQETLGPMWLGPLFDGETIRAMERYAGAHRPEELATFVDRFREESEVDVPFYYESNSLARALGLPAPPKLTAMLDGLRSEGFRAARTHVRPEGFRTDAPRPRVEAAARRLVGR